MGSCDAATTAATTATVCPATPRDTTQLEWGGRCRDLGCAGAQRMRCPARAAVSLPHAQWPSVGLMGPNSCPSSSHRCSVPALGCHHAVAKPTGGQTQGLALSWVGVPGTLELVQPLSTGCHCPPASMGTGHPPCRSCLGSGGSLLGSPPRGAHRHWDPCPDHLVSPQTAPPLVSSPGPPRWPLLPFPSRGSSPSSSSCWPVCAARRGTLASR